MKHTEKGKAVGKRKSNKEINEKLWLWYCEAKKQAEKDNLKLTKNTVQAQARKTFEEAGIKDFCASDGWYRRWVAKWRNKTVNEDICQEEPALNTSSHQDELSDLPLFCSMESFDSFTNKELNSNEFEFIDFFSNNSDSANDSSIMDMFESFNDILKDTDSLDYYHVFEYNTNSQVKKKKKEIIKPDIKKGQCYLPIFKEKVLEYARSHSYKQTALKYQINQNTLTEWIKENKRLQLLNKSTIPSLPNKTEDSSKTADQLFLDWVKQKRNDKQKLNSNEVYKEAAKYIDANQPPAWFLLWVQRFQDVVTNKVKTLQKTEPYIKYSNNFKLEVALYAKLYNKNSAARVFNIPRRRVYDWYNALQPCSNEDGGYQLCSKGTVKQKVEEELLKWCRENKTLTNQEIKAKAKCLFEQNGLEHLKCSEIWLKNFRARMNIKAKDVEDDELTIWILAQFDNNVALSHQNIMDKALQINSKPLHFKGSKTWTLRFLKRRCNLLQMVPSIDTKLPIKLQEKVKTFQEHVRSYIDRQLLSFTNIGCMDEIPIYFNYQQTAKKRPLLRKCGFEQCQAVVILSTCADGRILPPLVVLQGSETSLTRSADVFVAISPNSFVNQKLILDWVELIWFQNVSSPSLLLADSFNLHESLELRKMFYQHQSTLMLFPEGTSSHLQPVNAVSQQFLNCVNKCWEEYIGTIKQTYDRKCQCPNNDLIISWVNEAYHALEQDTFSIISSYSVRKLITLQV